MGVGVAQCAGMPAAVRRKEADLALHFQGEHYLNMRNTIAGFGLRAADVSKFRIDHQEPVYDPQGVPRADFFTA